VFEFKKNTQTESRLRVVGPLLLCFRIVLDLSPGTGRPKWSTSWYSSFPPGKCHHSTSE